MAISKIIFKSSASATPETWMDSTSATAAAGDIIAPKTAMLADGVITTGTGTGGYEAYTRTVIAPQQTITTTSSSKIKTITYTTALVDSAYYIVTYDGVEWLTTCETLWGTDRIIGSAQVMFNAADTVYPFAVDYTSSMEFVTKVAGTHTVKIERLEFTDEPTVLTTKTISSNGTYNASSDGADGYSSVTVNVGGATPSYQTKTVTPSTQTQNVTADNGYDALSQVTVNPIPSQYIIPSGNKEITANGTNIDVAAFSTVSVNVPTGGGGLTLLGTQSVGSVSTTSTSASDTGVSITVNGIYAYDLLICECSVDSTTNNRHAATTRLCWLTASSNINTKDAGTFATATWNTKLSSQGVATSRSNTTAYGVYANGITVSAGSTGDNGRAVITIYRRYNSTQTGTINGTYTMRVYGVKIYDLIGG